MQSRLVTILMGSVLTIGAVAFAQEAGEGEAIAPAEQEVAAAAPSGVDARLHDALFYLFGAVAVVSSLGVVFSGNIVRTAMWLFGTLGAVAALFFLMFANFLGAIQLIVYAGGILILIVFGVMLTSKSPWMRFDPKPAEVIGGSVVCLALLVTLISILLRTDWSAAARPRVAANSVAEFGEALLTDYLIPFEAASVLLLAVMIGAAFLARPEK